MFLQSPLAAAVWKAIDWRFAQIGWTNLLKLLPDSSFEVEQALFWLALLHR
jgi:hypothetical protein